MTLISRVGVRVRYKKKKFSLKTGGTLLRSHHWVGGGLFWGNDFFLGFFYFFLGGGDVHCRER